MRRCGSMNTPFISANLQEWMTGQGLKLRKGQDAQKGDIVLCSTTQNYEVPDELGTVLEVIKGKGLKLKGKKGAPHPDGDVGHIYVLTWSKQKLGGKKKLVGLLSMFLVTQPPCDTWTNVHVLHSGCVRSLPCCIHTHARTHIQMHARAFTHTHTFTYTNIHIVVHLERCGWCITKTFFL